MSGIPSDRVNWTGVGKCNKTSLQKYSTCILVDVTYTVYIVQYIRTAVLSWETCTVYCALKTKFALHPSLLVL